MSAADGFWVRSLDGAPPLLELPLDRPRVGGKPGRKGVESFSLDPTVCAALRRVGSDEGVPLFSTLLASVYILLSRYSRQDDVVIGTAFLQPGCHANVMPVRIDGSAVQMHLFNDLVATVHSTVVACLENCGDLQAVMPQGVAGASGVTGGSSTTGASGVTAGVHPLFQAMVTLAATGNPDDAAVTTDGRTFTTGPHDPSSSPSTPGFPSAAVPDIELHFSEAAGSTGLDCRVVANLRLFDRAAVQGLAEHMACLLRSVAAAVMPFPFRKLSLMSMAEHDRVVRQWNDTAAPWPEGKCIHELFEEQVALDPHHTAVIHSDPDEGTQLVTYGELDARCSHIARILRGQGVGSDVLVALVLERSVHMVEAIYGVLKAGGGYVPVDPEYPSARMLVILEDAQAPVLITQTALLDRLPSEYSGLVYCIDELPTAVPPPPPQGWPGPAQPSSIVYVFYTSGTTGKPKGVMVEHRGLVKRIQWFQDNFTMAPDDCMLQKTTYTFGMSEWEFFWCLPHGAMLFVTRPGGHKDPDYLLQVMQSNNVSHSCWVPSMLQLMLDHIAMAGANGATYMRHVFCTGEALSVNCCRSFMEGFANGRLHNLYGPTEADMTWWNCPCDLAAVTSKVPIGTPMSNVQVFILDKELRVCPVGVPGELHFGGVNTARGYIHLPELTAEKFIPNSVTGSGRLYKTGDVARWKPEGVLEFCGRVDHQIKLRGFRIELGDIEAALMSCEAVTLCVVTLHGDSAEQKKLVAYMVPHTLNPKDIQKQLRTKLPEYMVPHTYVCFSEKDVPRTRTGKIERNALPAPPEVGSRGYDGESGGCLAPSTRTQQTIADIWATVLMLPSGVPSVESDFIDLGGNSLLAGRAVSLIRKQFNCQLPGTALYTHSTIARLADLVSEHMPDPSEMDDAPAVVFAYRGQPSLDFSTMSFQLIGMVFLDFIPDAITWPAFAFGYTVYLESGLWTTMLWLPLVFVATQLSLFAIIAMCKHCFANLRPGTFPIFGSRYNRWWFQRKLIDTVEPFVSHLVGETVLANAFWSLLGASIGSCVEIDSPIHEPDMVSIGSYTSISKKVDVSAASFAHGELLLDHITVHESCDIAPRAFIPGGTVLPTGTVVGPLSTAGVGAHRDTETKSQISMEAERAQLRRFFAPQQALRIVCGVPIVAIVECLPYVPTIVILEALWTFLHTSSTSAAAAAAAAPAPAPTAAALAPAASSAGTDINSSLIFFCITPWIFTFVVPELYFWLVVIIKSCCGIHFSPVGPMPLDDSSCSKHATEFKRWLLSRLMASPSFHAALEPWVWTEVLCFRYRCLGMKVGRRVQPDVLVVDEPDLVEVEDSVVFGSAVVVCPHYRHEQSTIRMCKDANVLDHCTLMPGCVIQEGAILGTGTIAPAHMRFPAASIHTGNEAGKPVFLRQRRDIVNGRIREPSTADERMGAVARKRHESNTHWMGFNAYIIGATLLLHPISDLLQVAVIVIEASLYFNEDRPTHETFNILLYICVAPLLYFVLQLFSALLYVALKWAVVGRYKEGNYPFYDTYHYKWCLMMILRQSMLKHFEENVEGTVFGAWFLRLLGATVGDNVATFGISIEYDLLTLGDNVAVGLDCDTTCHTVENMVIKLAPVAIESDCSVQSQAIVMPGGTMEQGSTLMHLSQVLKGEVVPSGHTWAGLPAQEVSKRSVFSDRSSCVGEYGTGSSSGYPCRRHYQRPWLGDGTVEAEITPLLGP